jgi:hypothetical protein
MIAFRRSIPRVAAASLVFGGSSCSGTPTPDPADVGRAYCQGVERCDPTFFMEEYGTVDECLDYYLLPWTITGGPSNACDRASLIAQDCFNDAYYDLMCAMNAVEAAHEACADEDRRASEACD